MSAADVEKVIVGYLVTNKCTAETRLSERPLADLPHNHARWWWEPLVVADQQSKPGQRTGATLMSPTLAEWCDDMSRAPRDGTPVLLFFPNRYQGAGGISWGCFVNGDWLDSRAIRDNSATNWAPMPNPPGAPK